MGEYYLHYDQVGSLRAVSNQNGELLKEVTYDTFGDIVFDSNTSLKVPFGFAGGLYDSDTKLVRFGFRDHDPFTGRWTAKDPILFNGGDTNLYGYVLGDPVSRVDALGLWIYQDPRLKGKGVPAVMGGDSNNFWLAIFDMWNTYKEMKKANTKKSDKYFHCLANCRATNRGKEGKNIAKFISDFREWY
jgi:RHS repeat-associated protein